MTAAFTVECNSQTVLQQLAKLAARFEPKGMRPVMMEIGETLSEATKRRFDAAVAPDETPWLPLKKGTVLARIQRVLYNYGRPGLKKSYANKDGSLNKRGKQAHDKAAKGHPLIDTGQLKRSIRYRILNGGAGVAIGTDRFSGEWEGGAAVHQFGSRDGRIPARPFLGLSKDDELKVLDILSIFIAEYDAR